MADLLLYSRRGCCLCEGLQQRLQALVPAAALQVVDVDSDPQLQGRYGLEVPVLALRRGEGWIDLPRVPPRLTGERLQAWLAKLGALPPG
ncbi:MAG: glutaredoxin family protein [Synechococcus sp.]|nr:glutaredoxin family protein [Synechococcus sp.]